MEKLNYFNSLYVKNCSFFHHLFNDHRYGFSAEGYASFVERFTGHKVPKKGVFEHGCFSCFYATLQHRFSLLLFILIVLLLLFLLLILIFFYLFYSI